MHGILRAQRLELLRILKDFSIPISGLRPVEEAIVTAGGVEVTQVEPRTMASRRMKGLYFAGELLDVVYDHQVHGTAEGRGNAA